MKLTFVLPNLRLYGGIKSTIAMADALVGLGHDVTLVSPIIPGRDGQGWLNLRKSAAQVYFATQNLLRPPNWFSYRGRLQRPLLLSEAALPVADFLILTWWADVARLYDVSSQRGQPVHFVRSIETWGGPAAAVLATYQLDLPRIVSSAALRGQLGQMGSSALADTIHNGLDETFSELAFVERALHETPRIGVLYRKQDWKRMDDAFAVLARCMEDRPVMPVFFGERPSALHRKLMASWQAEYHHLPGGRALRTVFESLDVFLFTSDATEAFGNPPFEALAASVAVVTTEVGAAKELLTDGESAVLCDPRDVHGMTTSVLELLDSSAARLRIAAAGHRVASELSWKNAALKLERLLEEIGS